MYTAGMGMKGLDIGSFYNWRWKWMAVNHYNFPTKSCNWQSKYHLRFRL